MKIIFSKIPFALTLFLILLSCEKEFLITEPTRYISGKQIAEASKFNPDLQAANIAGVYTFMYSTGVGGTVSHTDFGQRAYDIFSDMLSADMTMPNNYYGWYRNLLQLTSTVDFSDSDNYSVWRYYYRVIRGANTVIDGLGGTDQVPTNDDGKFYMGQAKTMRAYGYFYLANFFGQEYLPDQPILPIYKNSTDPNQGLSTTAEVYDLIISDLEESIELLEGFTRTAKNQVNKEVAQGLLAYAALTMNDYQKSANASNEVINSGNFQLMDAEEVLGGFNAVSTPGWIWGVDLTTDIGLDLLSWWGLCDIYTFSYASFGDPKVIDQGLFDLIPDEDVRKNQFLNEPSSGLHLVPYYKFYHEDRVWRGQREVTADYLYMRIAEMYLLNAEANARNGNEAAARTALKTLLNERLPSTDYIDELSGQSLLDEIYLQTRIELWGEGKSYLAMKRFKATITKGSNHAFLPNTSYPYNDERLTFEIPEAEIIDNPQISKQ
ncbi:MAG: RagB/SusD family nutrient uptake outer membrane protein [Flavobacteriaceae bacterium]